MGEGVGRWPMEGGPFWVPGLIWLVRVGGWGEAWGGGPWRAVKGARWGGGHQRAVWEQ